MRLAQFHGRLAKLETQAQTSFEADLHAMSTLELGALIGAHWEEYAARLTAADWQAMADSADARTRRLADYRRWAKGRR